MAIFNDYRGHKYNAYLNWFFDSANMTGISDTLQRAFDDTMLGFGYLYNAANSIGNILTKEEDDLYLDVQIFPILFNIWQGIELELKGGNRALDLLLSNSPQAYNNHDIKALRNEYRAKLKRLGLHGAVRKHLVGLNEFVDECDAKNAHFDFARYTRMVDGSKQFYNTPGSDGFVPNTCVDIIELGNALSDMIDNFAETNNFLFDYISAYGLTIGSELSDANLDKYIAQTLSISEEIETEAKTLDELMAELKDRGVNVQTSGEIVGSPKTTAIQPYVSREDFLKMIMGDKISQNTEKQKE